MSLPAVIFKGLLATLAGQFIDRNQDHAECVGADFGTLIAPAAKDFFSISLIEEDLPEDLAAVGVLCDDTASATKRRSYTFFIYIDSSKKFHKITEDLKNIFFKLILSHEICHFAFYYELFFDLGANLSATLYENFQNVVSGKLKDSITSEVDITSETVVEEHRYRELIQNFGKYPDSHYARNNPTKLDYAELFDAFFAFLTEKTSP
jgi:hypothetical protein